MTVTKTHFAYRIDRWDADGESIMEHVAAAMISPWRWRLSMPP
jgi:hypothetical protein